MCEPISIIMASAAAAASAYGAYESSQAQKNQASYEADIAEQNAKLAYDTAGQEQRQAEESRRDIAMRALQDKGNAKTQYAASGMLMNGGSYQNYLNDVGNAYDTNVGRLDYDTNQKTTSYLRNAFNYSAQAQASRAQAKSVNTGLNTFSAGLKGASAGWNMGNGVTTAWKSFNTNLPNQ